MDMPYYKHTYRRFLVDMHIPDWDPAFLSKYDVEHIVNLYERAHVNAVMFYCQSHVGLCYWPTKTGKMHAALNSRDIVTEQLLELKKRNIAACAYYSVVFNNWAILEHPAWRMVHNFDHPAQAFTRSRYGHCCMNNSEYRAFAFAQTEELVQGYDFDGFFFDMTFWPGVCFCGHCREKYKTETGKQIPSVVDWLNPDWCRFQAARERWQSEFTRDLTQTVKRIKPGLPVYHNFATGFANWPPACPTSSAVHHDFLGGDFYGDPVEQLLVVKLMSNLTENRPLEFLTSRCVNLHDHVRLKPFEAMEMEAFVATLFSAAFSFIDAIDPVGTVNPAVYDHIGRIFAKKEPYEPYLGGEPVEDIAVYFSNESKMAFAENGLSLAARPEFSMHYPHSNAVRGAAAFLQQAHMPFGIITRKQMDSLSRYKLIILPNALRMDDREVDAFRSYVRNGGRLYASGWTSLTHTDGHRKDDFMLADVFGCHFGETNRATVSYIKPTEHRLAAWVAPQDCMSVMVSVMPGRVPPYVDPRATGVVLKEHADGQVLATLTLPYASPEEGSVLDENWSSIHSSPPWSDTGSPVLVRNKFGHGECVYSATDIESTDSEVNRRVFLGLMNSLLDKPLRYGADTHPAVWMHVQDQPEHNRVTIGFLNYQTQLPAVPIARVPFFVRPPEGKRFNSLTLLPERKSVAFATDSDGTLRAEARDLSVFQMFLAETV